MDLTYQDVIWGIWAFMVLYVLARGLGGIQTTLNAILEELHELNQADWRADIRAKVAAGMYDGLINERNEER